MTPEEILRKVGLNGKILKEYSLGRLLTNGDATHSTVILGDVSRYLEKKKIPIDLIGEIQEALIFELKSMVPESQMFKSILRGSKQIGERVIDFQNAFNNLVKAHLRMPLSMDTVKTLEEGTNNLERLFDELKEIREPGMYGIKDSVNEFDDFQIGIFDSTFDSNTNFEDYVNTKVKNVTEYVDDFVMPKGVGGVDIQPPGMAFMGSEIPNEKLITGPFDDMIKFTAAQELKGLIDPELAAKAAKILESSQEIGEAIVLSAKKFAKNALKVSGKTVGALDPGDVVITKSIPKLLAGLGVGSLSAGALTLYAIYEGALLLSDAVSGLQEANKKAGIGANKSEDFTGYSFTGGQTIDGRDVAYQQADFSSYGKDFWQGFTEDSVSDKYSLSYKLSKEIHNSLFGSVYGTIAETPKTPVGASGGGRVRIL